MNPLKGQQLSLLSEVNPYPLSNPPSDHCRESSPEHPDKDFHKGDRVLISDGYYNGKEALVVRVNRKTLTLLPEGAPAHAEIRMGKEYCWRLAQPSSPEQSAYPHRRHSAKGQASGWIEERQGNRRRKVPSTSYYYCWLEQGARRKCYVPVGKLWRLVQLLDQRRPVREIVAFLEGEDRP